MIFRPPFTRGVSRKLTRNFTDRYARVLKVSYLTVRSEHDGSISL